MVKLLKTLVITAQSSFDLPLAEATRKQAVELTKIYMSSNSSAELLVINPDKTNVLEYENVRISIVTLSGLFCALNFVKKFNRIHYIGALGYKALFIGMVAILLSKSRVITLTDGGVYSIKNRPFFRSFSSNLLVILYQKIFIYTEYQKLLLCKSLFFCKNKFYFTYPLLTMSAMNSRWGAWNSEEAESIDILYMGHLSMFKGVDIVLHVFEHLSQKMNNVCLVLALNGLAEDEELRKRLEMLKVNFPHRVIEKGKVNPLVELSRSSLYIYPVKQHSGTHAFPFSLYESMQCATPFVSTKLDGFAEYFDDFFLVEAGDMYSYASKAEEMLRKQYEAQRKLADNHARIKNKIQYWIK